VLIQNEKAFSGYAMAHGVIWQKITSQP
jgi:hypothetical protein